MSNGTNESKPHDNDIQQIEKSFKEAGGTLVAVDKDLFLTMIRYMQENELIDELSEYLEERNYTDIIIDVGAANHLKRFLLSRRMTDPKARLIIMCGCGGKGDGGGGGGPTAGVRG